MTRTRLHAWPNSSYCLKHAYMMSFGYFLFFDGTRCWISDETFTAIREKREAKGKDKNRYQELKTEVQRKLRVVQNEQLEQVDTFPYLGSLITEDGECTTEFRTMLNRGQAIGASLQKIWKSQSTPISTKI